MMYWACWGRCMIDPMYHKLCVSTSIDMPGGQPSFHDAIPNHERFAVSA